MSDTALTQAVLTVFGVMLTAISALMAWQALSVISAGRSIAVLESILKEISEELKRIGHHESKLAVLDNKVHNMKAEIDLCFERVKQAERDCREGRR